MTRRRDMHAFRRALTRRPFDVAGVAVALVLAVLLASCEKPRESGLLQGYVEGEFVYVASPLAGTLESLRARRGQQVKKGDPLFELESGSERAARAQAARKLESAQATLADARKGKRPSEVATIEAQLEQATVAMDQAGRDWRRLAALVNSGTIARQEGETAKATYDQDVEKVAEIKESLKTARLGSREDQVASAEADVAAQRQAVAIQDWNLAQKRRAAPQAGVVQDTLYREGEWVGEGKPVVMLLPPSNIKVRAFVPEPMLSKVRVGDRLAVRVDGAAAPMIGTVSFISPKAEYTPPVIYSLENRQKFSFMIELTFEPAVAAGLHPGQPVDVALSDTSKQS
jgi:HlyD family secretion protein